MTRRGRTASCTIPATWPAIKLPVRVAVKDGLAQGAQGEAAPSPLVAPSFSRARYSLVILFLSTRTGAPVERPVTTVELSLAPALSTACL